MHPQFRRPRLLIIGAGDVAHRALPQLRQRFRIFALSRQPRQNHALREAGIVPITGDLDHLRSLSRIGKLATQAVLHTAPPPLSGNLDPRTERLIAAMQKGGIIPRQWVYISTSGVYGDAKGTHITETFPTHPSTDRARRRLDAEGRLRRLAIRRGVSLRILRAPGIYAADRLPLDRLRQGTPLAHATEDSYSNHIHADDLAGMCVAALRARGGIRCYHATDNQALPVGEYFDALADHFHLPRAPRVSREVLQASVSPALWSFLRESRQLDNHRLSELGYHLKYPTIYSLLTTLCDSAAVG